MGANKLAGLAFVLALVALAGVFWPGAASRNEGKGSGRETAFERVLRTNTIRCGYATWYPEMVKDPKTGALSGYDYDVVNAIGEILGLKIEWAEETGWGTSTEGLASGRFDMACNGYWGPPARARAVFMSRPFVHHPVFVVTGAHVKPEGSGYAWLNDPRYKAVVMRGTEGELTARMLFPRARVMDANELASDGDIFQILAHGKADFAFSNLSPVRSYEAHGGKGLRVLDPSYSVGAGVLLLPYDDLRFKHMIDSALELMINNGRLNAVMRKHMGDDRKLWLPAAPTYVSAPASP